MVFPPGGLQYYLVLSSLCCIGKIWDSFSLGHYLLFKNNGLKISCYLISSPNMVSSEEKIFNKVGYF